MRLFPSGLSGLLFSLFLAGAPACGGKGFDPASKISSLRVLAVQKEPPYPAPGETVSLKLLYWDGKASASAGRSIDIRFFGCINPAADLYYNCFNQITGLQDLPDPVDAGTSAGASPVEGNTFKIPDSIISSRPPPASGPPYGLAYVFYTVCAGRVGLRTQATTNDLPLGCFGANDEALGPDDFVPGYSSLYVYDNRRNANPTVNDLVFNSQSIIGSTDLGDDDPAVPHVPLCPSADCEIDFKVDVDRGSAEQDTGSFGVNGEQLLEQVWVDFYSTRGEFTKPVRLINDATSGWNDDNATKFKVPADAGPVHLWAVVHDSRGGVEWREGKIVVQ